MLKVFTALKCLHRVVALCRPEQHPGGRSLPPYQPLGTEKPTYRPGIGKSPPLLRVPSRALDDPSMMSITGLTDLHSGLTPAFFVVAPLGASASSMVIQPSSQGGWEPGASEGVGRLAPTPSAYALSWDQAPPRTAPQHEPCYRQVRHPSHHHPGPAWRLATKG